MRGWVYVISNPAMPGIYKIGYSKQDPEVRATRLASTGVPHPFKVEFDALVHEPYLIEQRTHALLAHHRENKEWFRCTLDEAIESIKAIGGDQIILTNDRRSIIDNTASDFKNKQVSETAKKPLPFKTSTINSEPCNPKPIYSSRFVFDGRCQNCDNHFKVTISKYEVGAVCPHCFKLNKINKSAL